MLSFKVYGKVATAGSKRPFVYEKDGRHYVRLAPDNKRQKPWMGQISAAAAEAMEVSGKECLVGPVVLIAIIRLQRPKSHFGTGRNSRRLKPSAPRRPIVKPDSLKVCRAIEDAISRICVHDDSYIVEHHIFKLYDSSESAEIHIGEVGDPCLTKLLQDCVSLHGLASA